MSYPLSSTRYVQPVKLPEAGHRPEAGSDAVVSGWGTLSSGGSISEVLQFVVVPVVGHDDCNDAYGGDIHEESMICAGVAGKDSCQVNALLAYTVPVSGLKSYVRSLKYHSLHCFN